MDRMIPPYSDSRVKLAKSSALEFGREARRICMELAVRWDRAVSELILWTMAYQPSIQRPGLPCYSGGGG